MNKFPLLIKLINSRGSLSVQVHPDDVYAVRRRELHIDKALEVIDLKLRGERCNESSIIKREGFSKILMCSCKEFCLEIYDIENKMEECSDIEKFFVFTVVEGEGEIVSKYGTEKVERGCSILIPANLGSYSLIDKMRLLKSYVSSECQDW